jgi:hypothetical protein
VRRPRGCGEEGGGEQVLEGGEGVGRGKGVGLAGGVGSGEGELVFWVCVREGGGREEVGYGGPLRPWGHIKISQNF